MQEHERERRVEQRPPQPLGRERRETAREIQSASNAAPTASASTNMSFDIPFLRERR